MIKCFLDTSPIPVDISILDNNMKQAIDLARSRDVKYVLKQARH